MFISNSGQHIAGLSSSSYQKLLNDLTSKHHLSHAQIVEGASYSMAMVVRHALGSFARDGVVIALANNSFAGGIAIATLRHLSNAGAKSTLLFYDPAGPSLERASQLKTLESLNICIKLPTWGSNVKDFKGMLGDLQCLMWGILTDSFQTPKSNPVQELINLINDSPVPAHSIIIPPGVNPDTGTKLGPILYAASTLSLGVPLIGLDAGREYVGRHFLCDLSIPAVLYKEHGIDIDALFSEQPVVQVGWEKEDEV